MSRTTRRVIFFFPLKAPVFLVLGTFIPAQVGIYSSLRALPSFSFTRTGISVFTTRTLVLYLLLYQLPPSPLVQPMHSSYPRPTISIIILFTKLFSCFLGVLVVTVLWFFPPTVSLWYLACRLSSSFIAAVYVIGGHSSLLPFFVVKRVHILTTTPSFSFKSIPFHEDGKSSRLPLRMKFRSSLPASCFCQPNPPPLLFLVPSVIDTHSFCPFLSHH